MADTGKLTITRVSAGGGAARGTCFEVMINPATYSTTTTVVFTEQKKLSKVPPPVLSLPTLVLDGTGVVPCKGTARSVDDQLQALTEVLFDVGQVNDKDAQPVVKVAWGEMRFEGRAQSMEVKYTLFTPEGVPLRASVTLRLVAPGQAETDKPQKGKSAKIERQLAAMAGTLSQLCFESYRDPSLDQQVARDNGLTSIRNVPPGTRLTLPSGA
jgi:hypothetical protein